MENNIIERITDLYENSPATRALIQLVINATPCGIGSALDAALMAHLNNLRTERLHTFFTELASGEAHLVPELITTNDFLHSYFATLTAALRTHREEKIRSFARLLITASARKLVGSDIFEEYLSILDDISFLELQILHILNSFEKEYPYQITEEGDREEDLQRSLRFWSEFENAVHTKLNINKDELRAMLTRLNRTSLYETFTGAMLDYSGGLGKLTPRFHEFNSWIERRNENIASKG